MGRLKKEVAKARIEFLDSWTNLAEYTEEQIENFRRILEAGDIQVDKEFIDRYIETATEVAQLYRDVRKNLERRNDKKAMDLAFKASVYEDTILDKYTDFFNPLNTEVGINSESVKS